ncbi:MAG: hypothetical protein U9N30_02880 [Campylobacterota bacterium]|nr:hypothetical protein [Campylobacterota bacterium]
MRKFLFVLFLSIELIANEGIDVDFKNLKIDDLITMTAKILNVHIDSKYDINAKVNYKSKKKLTQHELLNLLTKSLNNAGYRLKKSSKGYTVALKLRKKTDKKKKTTAKKTIRIIDLDNALAQNIVQTIQKMAIHFDPVPFVDIDKDTNCILLMGKEKHLEQLQSTINHLDKKHPQVFVEAKIVEMSMNRVKNIGLQYGLAGGMIGNDGLFSYAAKMNGSVRMDLLDNTVFNIDNLQKGLALGATINLLKQNFALDIVSEPSILCMNNQEASIYVGKTVSILTQTSGTADNKKDSYNRENIGLSLKIKPRINTLGKVHLNIDTILEDIDTLQGTNDQPITSKKQVKTSVLLNHGESVILGGLIKNQTSSTIQKIPILGDLPVLGNLFSNYHDINDKINLVVIITPYVIQPHQNITYAREELSKLKVLEYQYTKRLIEGLNTK